MDSLTELCAQRGRVLTKRIRPGAEPGSFSIVPYDKTRHYSVVEHPVGSFDDLTDVLATLEHKPTSCVILDRPKETAKADWTERNSTLFDPVARRYLPIDLDGIKLLPGLDWRTDPEAVVRYAIEMLLPAFRDISCFWQFTAGQGFKEGLRLRLWFWLDRPVTCAEIKLWLCEKGPHPSKPASNWQQVTPVDASLYDRVHVIYTARPIFEGGMADPVPRRSGVLRGARDAVSVPLPIEPRFPTLARSASRAEKASRPALAEGVTSPYRANGTGYEQHVDAIGDGPGGEGFYGPMRSAVAAWVGREGADADPTEMLHALAAAARRAPRDPGKHSMEDVETRIANLSAQTEWMRERQRETDKRNAALLAAVGQRCDAGRTVPTSSREEAAEILAQAMNAWSHEAWEASREWRDFASNATPDELETVNEARRFFSDPRQPRTGIAAGIGLGKTEAALNEVASLISKDPTLRIAFALPTHATAADVARRARALPGAPRCDVYRGIAQPDPLRPGLRMCPKHLIVEQVVRNGGRVSHVCGGRKYDWCPHNPRQKGGAPAGACGYRQQYDADVQLWFVVHAMLTGPAPRSFMNEDRKRIGAPFDMTVIDEAPWPGFFGGLNDRDPVEVPVGDLLSITLWPTSDLRSTYKVIADKLSVALNGQAGLLKRAPFVAAGLTVGDAEWAGAAAYRLRRRSAIRHDLSPEAAALAVQEDGAVGRSTKLIAQFWRVLASFLRSGEALAPETLQLHPDGPSGAYVRLRWKEDIHPHWLAGPVLCLDATMIPEIAAEWLPNMSITLEAKARETHVWRVGVSNRTFGKSRLTATNVTDEEKGRQNATLKRISRLIERFAFLYRGRGAKPGPDVAVATFKDFATRLAPHLPANVEVGHFNNLRGFDGWRGVAVQIVIGRPEAKPRDVEIRASIMRGQLVPALPGYYPRADGALLLRDGSGVRVSTVAHPDPLAEAFRRQGLTEIEQIEGRARPVRRDVSRPLLSIVLTSTPTDLPYDEVLTAEAILEDASIVDTMFARGLVLDTAIDAAKVLSDLFVCATNPAAALRQRLHRAGEGGLSGPFDGESLRGGGAVERVTSPYENHNMAMSHPGEGALGRRWFEAPVEVLAKFESFQYRLAGTRVLRRALVDLARHPHPEVGLAAAVGPVEHLSLASRPGWLAPLRALFDPATRQPVGIAAPVALDLPLAPSPFEVLLATKMHAANAMLPLADEIYTVGAHRLSVHLFRRGDNGADLRLYRKPGATWPPQRASKTPILVEAVTTPEPTTTAFEIAAELGARPRALMVGPKWKMLESEFGQEKALVLKLKMKFGAEALQAAGARCLARSAARQP